MLVKNLAIVTCLASAAMAEAVGSIFCQARYITNVATCVIGVTECNALLCLLYDPYFVGTLQASDYSALIDAEKPADVAEAKEDL
ncbi:hypothetical protein BG005_011309 [Podila minutissima]|nr:hypothetical protein BG005_011309 [Podila minutissima]